VNDHPSEVDIKIAGAHQLFAHLLEPIVLYDFGPRVSFAEQVPAQDFAKRRRPCEVPLAVHLGRRDLPNDLEEDLFELVERSGVGAQFDGRYEVAGGERLLSQEAEEVGLPGTQEPLMNRMRPRRLAVSSCRFRTLARKSSLPDA